MPGAEDALQSDPSRPQHSTVDGAVLFVTHVTTAESSATLASSALQTSVVGADSERSGFASSTAPSVASSQGEYPSAARAVVTTSAVKKATRFMEPAPRRLRRALERRKPISPPSYRLLRTRHGPCRHLEARRRRLVLLALDRLLDV